MHSLERLGCNLDNLSQRVNPFTGQGVQLEAIKEQFIFASEDFPNDKTIACSYGRLCGLNSHYHVSQGGGIA
jgi:hypothetical protein